MWANHYYHLCNRYKGKPVKITTHYGRVYCGFIQHVDRYHVYLQPLHAGGGLGGFGYGGFYGPDFFPGYGGYGYGSGLGFGIALGVIGSLALLPFFW